MVRDQYFFCGIAGSGMRPLAMYLHGRGCKVSGSDRSFDQGRFSDVAAKLKERGIAIFPQDGSGLTFPEQILVTSSAVEAQIPDVLAAKTVGAQHKIRAEVLSDVTNNARLSCGIAGTSGKSTTTSMLAHILVTTGHDPSVVNGAPMLNELDADGQPQGWRVGTQGPFVTEVDESDGSIAMYTPSVGVITNISEDHKSMDELDVLFTGYAERSHEAVLGIDSEPVAAIAARLACDQFKSFGLTSDADFTAGTIEHSHDGLSTEVRTRAGDTAPLHLPMIGTFNISNALAAIAAASFLDVTLSDACAVLQSFAGTARRLQPVGRAGGVTVIDDFAHNPDKIKASLSTLTEHYPRLHVMYQPHGYGPLRSMHDLYQKAFASSLRKDDTLTITEPVYFGGTVEPSEDARLVAEELSAQGCRACYIAHRDLFAESLEANSGEAVIVMGARDDSLTPFAQSLVEAIGQKSLS
ncbi:MAG: Mur ligase family protein [Pseudomonadota bacterium]